MDSLLHLVYSQGVLKKLQVLKGGMVTKV